jgi:hypothetical protein
VSFLRRQSIIAALTVNALRPPRGQRQGVPSFLAGWPFGETAPQMLALTAACGALVPSLPPDSGHSKAVRDFFLASAADPPIPDEVSLPTTTCLSRPVNGTKSAD